MCICPYGSHLPSLLIRSLIPKHKKVTECAAHAITTAHAGHALHLKWLELERGVMAAAAALSGYGHYHAAAAAIAAVATAKAAGND